MAISNPIKITKVDPKQIVTPLLKQSTKKGAQPLPSFVDFVAQKTGVKSEFTPTSKVLQSGSSALKGETARIATATKQVAQKQVETKAKQEAAKPKYTMKRQDVVDAMVEKNPRLAEAYSAGEVTSDDIYAASLEKYAKIRAAHQAGEIDSTQRVQEQAEATKMPSGKSSIGEKVQKWATDGVGGLYKSAQAIPSIVDTVGTKAITAAVNRRGSPELKAYAAKTPMQDWRSTVNQQLNTMGVDQESTAFNVGRSIGNITQMAGLPGMGAIRGGGVAMGALKGAAQGAAGTQMESFADTGKAASLKDTAIGAGVGAVFGGISGKSAKDAAKQTLAKKVAQGANVTKDELGNKGNKLLRLIAEGESVRNKRQALREGRLVQKSGISKRWSGQGDVVQPSQKSLNSVGEIVSTIKNPSTNVNKLNAQVNTRISQLAKGLSSKLQTIELPYREKFASKPAGLFRDFISEGSDGLGTNRGKKMQVVFNDFKKSKTLDDVWNTAKKMDDMIPDKIKKGQDLSAKEELVRDAWRKAREALNDYMEEGASSIGDANVKKNFLSMSRLYHAIGQLEANIGDLTKKTVGAKTKIINAAKYAAGAGALYAAGRAGIKTPQSSFSNE